MSQIEREAATLQSFVALLRDRGFSGLLAARSIRKFPSEEIARTTINRMMDDLGVSSKSALGLVLAAFSSLEDSPEPTELELIVDGAVSCDTLVRLARRLPRRYHPECGLPSRSLMRACLRVFHYNNARRLNVALTAAAGDED
ncbi:MAG TPA: hypothetical protein VLA77_03600 [Candidatus Saccharimonadales bacterium]|nr:hypothetical protein [Candidatus Saccharimonadales bacterium]